MNINKRLDKLEQRRQAQATSLSVTRSEDGATDVVRWGDKVMVVLAAGMWDEL